jgi:Cu(I)/Ag(I) efflux system membrane fusion protein
LKEVPGIDNRPVSAAFLSRLQRFDAVYFEAADALTNDDFEKAKTKLVALKELAVSMTSPRGEQYSAWENIRETLKKDLEHAHHAAGLPDVRTLFDKVSRQVITLEKQYGHSTGSRCLAFCPMAFGNKGAYWLQTEKKIRNPYFGKKMHGCGEIKETYAGK